MTTPRIKIVIPGQPVAKGRHRTTQARIGYNNNGDAYVIQGHTYTPPETKKWEEMAGWRAKEVMRGAELLTTPIHLSVVAFFSVPASWPAWKRQSALTGEMVPSGKPDLDNVVKAVKDAFNGIVWVDDGLVVSISSTKRYNEHPGVVAEVTPLLRCGSQVSTKGEYDQFLINHREEKHDG